MNLSDWSLKEKRDTASLTTWSAIVAQNTMIHGTLTLVTVEATGHGEQ